MNLDFIPSLGINEFLDGIEQVTKKRSDLREKSAGEIIDELSEQNMYPDCDPFGRNCQKLFSHDESPGWIFEAINEIIAISGAKRIIVYA